MTPADLTKTGSLMAGTLIADTVTEGRRG
jgi:hypothetical protein